MKNSKLRSFVKRIDETSILKDSEIIKLKGGKQLKDDASACAGFACGLYKVV